MAALLWFAGLPWRVFASFVVVGAMIALGHAETPLEMAIGFFAVALGAANAAGGYVVTERMLAMFKKKEPSDNKAGGQS